MSYAPDPGEKFESDVHRRVLGHLSTPLDDFGWTLPALQARLGATHESFDEAALDQVLTELEADGHAKQHDSGAWQMTDAGFEAITEEPPTPDQDLAAASLGAATPLGEPQEKTDE